MEEKLTWLPTTKKEVERLGWDELDVILFSGDAYIDHLAFGAAVFICAEKFFFLRIIGFFVLAGLYF